MKKTADISINDRVRVTDSGETYSSHSEAFLKMGFSDCESNPGWENGEEGRVFATASLSYQSGGLFALVHDDGRECLISGRGIELVQQAVTDNTQIDSIITRLSEIESKLDQYAQFIASQNKPQTAVGWLIEELSGFDSGDGEDYYDICLAADKFTEIKCKALEMEKQQNSK